MNKIILEFFVQNSQEERGPKRNISLSLRVYTYLSLSNESWAKTFFDIRYFLRIKYGTEARHFFTFLSFFSFYKYIRQSFTYLPTNSLFPAPALEICACHWKSWLFARLHRTRRVLGRRVADPFNIHPSAVRGDSFSLQLDIF